MRDPIDSMQRDVLRRIFELRARADFGYTIDSRAGAISTGLPWAHGGSDRQLDNTLRKLRRAGLITGAENRSWKLTEKGEELCRKEYGGNDGPSDEWKPRCGRVLDLTGMTGGRCALDPGHGGKCSS